MKVILKTLLGILSCTPILVLLAVFISEALPDFHIPYKISRNLDVVFWGLTPALVLIYFVILFTSNRLKSDTKTLWACLFLVGHIISIPVFFFVNVWNKEFELI